MALRRPLLAGAFGLLIGWIALGAVRADSTRPASPPEVASLGPDDGWRVDGLSGAPRSPGSVGSEVDAVSGPRPILVRTGPPDFVSPGYPPDYVERGVRSRMALFGYCYQKIVQVDPSLEGRVRMVFTIGSDGAVADARVESSTIDSVDVESCVTRVVRTIRFHRAASAVRVRYPFVFAQGEF